MNRSKQILSICEKFWKYLDINKLSKFASRKEEEDDVEYYIRLDRKGLKPGYKFPNSREWDDGHPTGNVLNGTSVFKPHVSYGGIGGYEADSAYLVTGKFLYEGNDYGEVLLDNAKVVMEIKV